jgi:short-subunit dehydrogenase
MPDANIKPWLVTGASRGLGAALVMELTSRGHTVIAIAREPAGLAALQARAGQERVIPCALDLANVAQIGATLAAVLAPYSHLSGLINNAGIGFYRPFLEHSESELINIINVNLTAAMLCSYAVLPRLLAARSGHIVNIASDLGRRPLAKMAPYVASKHGLNGFSHSLLREVKGAGVRVSLVNPGMIDTGFGGDANAQNGAGQRDEASHLKVDALAKLIVDLTEQPGHLLIDELNVHPLHQQDF